MIKGEALMLVRLVKGICPAQQLDEYTPDAWATVLEDTSFDDAKSAVISLARQKPFIALSDICIEVKRVRAKRFDGVKLEELGAGPDADDVAGYLDKVRADRKAIADGIPVDELDRPRAIEAAS